MTKLKITEHSFVGAGGQLVRYARIIDQRSNTIVCSSVLLRRLTPDQLSILQASAEKAQD